MAKGNWVNIGDVSPWHGQVWFLIPEDETQDYVEVVEVISPSDLESLADNQVLIVSGSVYIPQDNDKAMEERLEMCGQTLEDSTFLDKAYASFAYSGIEQGSEMVVQVGKAEGDYLSRIYVEPIMENPDVVLHGNCKLENYIKKLLES